MNSNRELVSANLSKIACAGLFIYLLLKGLICPYFNPFDKMFAICVHSMFKTSGTFVEMIAASSSDGVYLPEVRGDILFELGLHFK